MTKPPLISAHVPMVKFHNCDCPMARASQGDAPNSLL